MSSEKAKGGGGGSKQPNFPVGPSGKRELRRALLKSTDPSKTIATFQTTKSLHSMFARAFGTTPIHELKKEDADNENIKVESLDTDSALLFLHQLGVSQHEINRRISDTLQKQLEEEVRKTNNQAALLTLLQNSWPYATVLPELRPVLLAVLKQLGDQTPLAVLNAFSERDDETGKLKHLEIFKSLPSLLKRLVWEADWDAKLPLAIEQSVESPKQYLKLVQSTLLVETAQPMIEAYTQHPTLLESAQKPFVYTARERRVLTTQRRALATAAASSTTTTSTSALVKSSAAAGGGSNATISKTKEQEDSKMTTGKAVSQLRQFLGNTTGGTASYRPKLLHAVLQLLMASHGNEKPNLLGAHLHCTLVADILLSAGGPLPKAYTHVHKLARILDDSVKNGVLSDNDLMAVQATLRQIYHEDDASEEAAKQKMKEESSSTKKSKKSSKDQPNTFLKRQLNRIITNCLNLMKDNDPQNLFLNPVTDAIAPGYSKIIKKGMSISSMEIRVDNSVYNSMEDWEKDVKLMFKNCIDYNRGQSGQWFRTEANRQQTIFKKEILPQAKAEYQKEFLKRNPEDDFSPKRKREDEDASSPKIEPLPAANKKQKIEKHEYTPSMPALAAMLLADPFVVRLLIDRTFRCLRLEALQGSTLPASHGVIPSLLQLLYLAQWSSQICALRGQRYVVPDSGLEAPELTSVEEMVPYESLRRFLPIIMSLLLESQLDMRLVKGGDLHEVADQERPTVPTLTSELGSTPVQVAVALLEACFAYICLPGNFQDESLSITFGKFAKVLKSMSGVACWEERAFFACLTGNILRQKTRLNRANRDAIIETWIDWLKAPSDKKKKKGSMTSAAHEYLMHLINEWSGMGNLLMPRDLLLKTTKQIVDTVNSSESSEERKFSSFWKLEKSDGFDAVKKQYTKMLLILPDAQSEQWQKEVGIIAPDDKTVDDSKPQTEESKGDTAVGNDETIPMDES
jgi:hypothetical protein